MGAVLEGWGRLRPNRIGPQQVPGADGGQLQGSLSLDTPTAEQLQGAAFLLGPITPPR